MKFNKETQKVVIKTAVVLVTGVAVAAVTTACIKGMVPIEDFTKFNKAIFKIGTFVISSMVAEAGAGYTGGMVDRFFVNQSKEPKTEEVQTEPTPA